MSGLTFEQLRIPAALILIIIAVFIFLPRDAQPSGSAATSPTPTVAVIVGEPGGVITGTPTPVPTPIPTLTPAATPTPAPTPQPVANDSFAAAVQACRSISGASCRGPLGRLPASAGSFTALVTFTDASAGDTINVVLTGPAGTIAGGPYTLGGGGDGYYYSTFTVGGLPRGDYQITAYRNGAEVAETTFRRAGG